MIKELLIFIRKQASSSLFGGLMLFFLLASQYITIPGLYRYDFLFIVAILIQIILIVAKLETPKEVVAIVCFHVFATVMELFKTSPSVGSWAYPEQAIFAIGAVPLFTGFLYSSVGSYMTRAWRINKFVFTGMPNRWVLLLVGALIYANFFTNHYIYDVRWIIFALLIVIFWKTKLHATLTTREFTIHPLVSNGLLALFVWLAEQIGTFARVWIYPHQAEQWAPVTFHMYTSWYMLLIFSFIIISLITGKERVVERGKIHA